MADCSRPPLPGVQILRLPQVCKVTGLGRSMIYQLESQRRFPCRVRIGARAVGWVEAEVQGWLAGRVEHFRVFEQFQEAPAVATLEPTSRRASKRAPGKAFNRQTVDSQLTLFAAGRHSGGPLK